MSREMFSEDARPYQRIDVVAAPAGWLVSENGRPTGRFEDIESAYKNALAICNTLFEQGVRARVWQTPALNA